jgi:hypothetical protein
MKMELDTFVKFARQALGFAIRIELDISVTSAQPAHTNLSADALEAAKRIPIVAFAADLFNASIVDVQEAAVFSPGTHAQAAPAAHEAGEQGQVTDEVILEHEELLSE